MPRKTQYSEKVDRHIYDVGGGCETQEDWIQLALAALDQAGIEVQPLQCIEAIIREEAESSAPIGEVCHGRPRPLAEPNC